MPSRARVDSVERLLNGESRELHLNIQNKTFLNFFQATAMSPKPHFHPAALYSLRPRRRVRTHIWKTLRCDV
jgi:hypothetical protein